MENTKEKEVCITKEEYQVLMSTVKSNSKFSEEGTELLKAISTQVSEVQIDLKIIKPIVQMMNTLVVGNGHPESGLVFRLTQLESWKAEHDKDEEDRKQKTWEITKPIIVDLAKMILFGGSAGGMLALVLKLLGVNFI